MYAAACWSASRPGRRLDDAIVVRRRARCARTCASAARPRRARPGASVGHRGLSLAAPVAATAGARAASSSGSVKRNAAPPPGRCSTQMRPPCALDDAAADGEPEADAAALALAHAIELVEDALGVLPRDAGPAVGDLDLDLAVARAARATSMGLPAACTWSRSRAG